MLVDSHCHLSFKNLGEYTDTTVDILQEAHKKDVTIFLDIILKRELLSSALSFSAKHSMVYNAFANHPCDIENNVISPLNYDELTQIVNSNQKIIGIGETGLDYYYSKSNKKHQIQAFETHCEVASTLKKPIIVHTRHSTEDTVNILSYYVKNKGLSGVIHCFSENKECAKLFLDLGFLISFSGIVTFKNATEIQEAAVFVPNDKILVETDSPYLAPVPYRGKVNQPAYTYYIAKFIANLKNKPLKDIAFNTTNNFKRLFSIKDV